MDISIYVRGGEGSGEELTTASRALSLCRFLLSCVALNGILSCFNGTGV